MEDMFCGCEQFNQPLERWNVSKVRNMSYMFWGCERFNQPLERWNLLNIEIWRIYFLDVPLLI